MNALSSTLAIWMYAFGDFMAIVVEHGMMVLVWVIPDFLRFMGAFEILAVRGGLLFAPAKHD